MWQYRSYLNRWVSIPALVAARLVAYNTRNIERGRPGACVPVRLV